METPAKKEDGLQDVILELMVSNETLGRIDKSLVTLSAQEPSKAEATPSRRKKPTKRELEDSKMLAATFNKLFDIDHNIRIGFGRFLKNDENLLNDTNMIWEKLDELLQFFQDGKLQGIEDKKEFNKLLHDLIDKKDDKKPAKKEDEKKEKSFWEKLLDFAIGLGTVIAAAGAMLVGMGLGAVESIGKLLSTLLGGVAGLGGKVLRMVFGDSKVMKWIEELKVFFKPVTEWFKDLHGWFVKDGVSLIKSIEESGGFFGKVIGWMKNIGSKFFKLGNLLGKLAVPLLILTTAYDTIKSMIDAYKSGAGIGGIAKAGLTGLLNSLVGSVLDFLKDVVSWILAHIGLKSIADMLNKFSFMDQISIGVDYFMTALENLFTHIGDIMVGLHETVTSFVKNAIDVFMDLISLNPIKMKRGYRNLKNIGENSNKFQWSEDTKSKYTGSWGERSDQAKAERLAKETKPDEKKPAEKKADGTAETDAEGKPKALGDMLDAALGSLIGQLLPGEIDKPGAKMFQTKMETDDLNEMQAIQASGGDSVTNNRSSTTNDNSSAVFNLNGMTDRTDSVAKPAYGY